MSPTSQPGGSATPIEPKIPKATGTRCHGTVDNGRASGWPYFSAYYCTNKGDSEPSGEIGACPRIIRQRTSENPKQALAQRVPVSSRLWLGAGQGFVATRGMTDRTDATLVPNPE